MADAFGTFEALWQRLLDAGCGVHYVVPFDSSIAGLYVNLDGHTPEIQLSGDLRDECQTPRREATEERQVALLYTLAHEGGHFESQHRRMPLDHRTDLERATAAFNDIWRRENNAARDDEGKLTISSEELNDRARTATRDELPKHDRDLIYDEEQRAWAIGRESLEQLGWTDFADWDHRTDESLHRYRYRFGLEELRPGEK